MGLLYLPEVKHKPCGNDFRMTEDEQRLESLDGMQRSNFMLHYNFPPFQ